MGRKNFGKKKKNQQKKQKKGRKPSKGYPGIPQEQVTCREVAIYVPPEEDSDQESDYDDDDDFYEKHDQHSLFMAMMFWEMIQQNLRTGLYGGMSFAFSGRRARR